MNRIPKWAWVLVAGGLLVGAYFIFRTPAAAAPASQDTSAPLPANAAAPDASGDDSSDAATADLLAALGQQNSQLEQTLLSQVLAFNGGYQSTPSSTGVTFQSSPMSTSTGGLSPNPISGALPGQEGAYATSPSVATPDRYIAPTIASTSTAGRGTISSVTAQ